MPSKRKYKSKPDKLGKKNECKTCGIITQWFVVYGNGVLVCLSCHEEQRWHHLSATKEAITIDGGSNGLKRAVPKRIGNLCQDSWVEDLLATSKSKPETDD